MPVPGTPVDMMAATSAFDRRWSLALPAMLGARSPPRPSKPWHPAQDALKVRFPGREPGLKSSSQVPCCRVCELATKMPAAQKTRRAGMRRRRRLARNGMGFYLMKTRSRFVRIRAINEMTVYRKSGAEVNPFFCGRFPPAMSSPDAIEFAECRCDDAAGYFCDFTAIAEISMRALFTRAAA